MKLQLFCQIPHFFFTFHISPMNDKAIFLGARSNAVAGTPVGVTVLPAGV